MLEKYFTPFSSRVAEWAGGYVAFLAALALVIGWAAFGPVTGYSDGWMLVINTTTTIVTFLMVFLIQNTQNRDGVALQTKLDELIRSSNAEDDFIGIEKLTDKELIALHERCEAAAKKSQETLEKARTERKRRGHHDHRVDRGSNARSIDP